MLRNFKCIENQHLFSQAKGLKESGMNIRFSERFEQGLSQIKESLDQKDEKTQWTIYNTIREIESTFRLLKTDLDLRPVYHKTDEAVMAHLHLGLLAYWVVNTIRYQLKQKGINNQWRDIVRIMNTQKNSNYNHAK